MSIHLGRFRPNWPGDVGRAIFAIAATVLPNGSGFAAIPPAVGDVNLIANGDFRAKDPEQRPLRWIMGKGLPTAVVTTKQHHGAEKDDAGVEVTDSSGTESLVLRSEKHIANPGTTYVARAWMKAGSGQPAGLYLEFWDQNAARIGVTSAFPRVDASWQPVTVALAAPDNATHVSVAIATKRDEVGVSLWDDVSLVPEIPYDERIKAGARELFLDNYRLESLVDVERVVHAGRKSKPLISATEPWEGSAVYIYGTVLRDQPAGTGYRMWYTAYSDTYYLCYATSADGVTWQKPRLGIVDYKGSKENNITSVGGGTFVFDPDDAEASRRYKLMTYLATPKEKAGYAVRFSPDGLHWTSYEKNPVILYGDVSNVAYDREARLFIASTKQRMLVANTSVTPGKQDRAAFVSVSRNFIDWTAPGAPASRWTLAVEGDPADDLRAMAHGGIEAQIYGMPVFPYEGIYIGLPWVFEIADYRTGIYAVTGDGPIQPQIAASRDLRHWSSPAREPVLPLGKAGAWDDGTLYTSSTWQVSADEVELYFGAMNMTHGGRREARVQTARIAKATWRRDGFVSLSNAGDDPGVITTRPIVFTAGTRLKVNAELSRGSLAIEILDPEDKPLSGFARDQSVPLTGDQRAASASWQGNPDLASLRGKPIKLRFHLKGGDLYSYWFE